MTPSQATTFFNEHISTRAQVQCYIDGKLFTRHVNDSLPTCLRFLRMSDKNAPRTLTYWPWIDGAEKMKPITDEDIDLLIECYTNHYGPE